MPLVRCLDCIHGLCFQVGYSSYCGFTSYDYPGVICKEKNKPFRPYAPDKKPPHENELVECEHFVKEECPF